MENKTALQGEKLYSHSQLMEAIHKSNEKYINALRDHLAVCMHIPPIKVNLGTFESKLDLMLNITGCKTKEDLIRYIVCDGEPVDESCVGHLVLFVDDIDDKDWTDGILTEILLPEEKLDQDTAGIYGCKFVSQNCGHLSLYYNFAKKKPGYDYTRKAE